MLIVPHSFLFFKSYADITVFPHHMTLHALSLVRYFIQSCIDPICPRIKRAIVPLCPEMRLCDMLRHLRLSEYIRASQNISVSRQSVRNRNCHTKENMGRMGNLFGDHSKYANRFSTYSPRPEANSRGSMVAQ